MTDTIKSEDGKTRVGYLELSEGERKIADAAVEQVKGVLVQGFRDELRDTLKKQREEWENQTDPLTRPGFSASADPAAVQRGAETKARFSASSRAVVDKGTGRTVRWKHAGDGNPLPAGQELGESKGGWLPPTQMGLDDRDQVAQEFGELVDKLAADDSTYNVLKFPRGDIDNFSIARWAMAVERAQNTAEGTAAYTKWAP